MAGGEADSAEALVPYSPTSPAPERTSEAALPGSTRPTGAAAGARPGTPAASPRSAQAAAGPGGEPSPPLPGAPLEDKREVVEEEPKVRIWDLQGDTEIAEGETEPAVPPPAARATAPPVQLSGGASARGCPQLLTGTRLDKAFPLQHNQWVKIGRHEKAQLRLENSGVCRNQCSVRWDHHQRKVELRVESSDGTLVNGRKTKAGRLALEHGDLIRVMGKGKVFEFVLDLRPVGLGFGDPVREVRTREQAASQPLRRRETLRAQLRHLQQALAACEAEASEREREYYEVVIKRKLRTAQLAERKEKYEFYKEGLQKLELELEESRKAWMRKLDAEYKANDDGIQPTIDQAAFLQEKVEKLHLKKDTLARSIHPEQYAVADVGMSLGALQGGSEGTGPASSRGRESDGEEDAFANLPGLRAVRSDDGPKGEDAPPKVAELEDAYPATKVLKREGEAATAAPEEAKRPRTDDEHRSGASGDTLLAAR